MREKIELINKRFAKEAGIIDSDGVSYEEAKDAIKNPENFAKRIEASNIKITPGVWMNSRTIELGEGNFTNVYDFYFNKKNPKLSERILTKQVPLRQHRLFVNENKKLDRNEEPIVCINGAFFFLQHKKLEKYPSEIIFNLNIRKGNVLGLPAADRPALFVGQDGHIKAAELKSEGVIEIGDKKIAWIGGEPIAHNKKKEEEMQDHDAVLYNSACCTIQYLDPNDKTSLKMVREDLNMTPRSKDKSDIVVTSKKENGGRKLYVTSINIGGGTNFFEGNFILQTKNDFTKEVKIGTEVIPEILSGLKLSEIESAMTTGPSVHHFLNDDDHDINHDPSVGTFPPFMKDTRYARSVLYEDNADNVHMVVFDGVPRSKHMRGVSPKEVAENIPSDVKWAVFLDGGQSSRVTFKTGDKLDSRGNQQYLRLAKIKEGQTTNNLDNPDSQFVWTKKGRALSSMIVLYRKLKK